MRSLKPSAARSWYEPPNYWHAIKGGELATSLMSAKEVREYLAKIGAKGGAKSRRALTREQAKAMVDARERKRSERAAGAGVGKKTPRTKKGKKPNEKLSD